MRVMLFRALLLLGIAQRPIGVIADEAADRPARERPGRRGSREYRRLERLQRGRGDKCFLGLAILWPPARERWDAIEADVPVLAPGMEV